MRDARIGRMETCIHLANVGDAKTLVFIPRAQHILIFQPRQWLRAVLSDDMIEFHWAGRLYRHKLILN